MSNVTNINTKIKYVFQLYMFICFSFICLAETHINHITLKQRHAVRTYTVTLFTGTGGTNNTGERLAETDGCEFYDGGWAIYDPADVGRKLLMEPAIGGFQYIWELYHGPDIELE